MMLQREPKITYREQVVEMGFLRPGQEKVTFEAASTLMRGRDADCMSYGH